MNHMISQQESFAAGFVVSFFSCSCLAYSCAFSTYKRKLLYFSYYSFNFLFKFSTVAFAYISFDAFNFYIYLYWSLVVFLDKEKSTLSVQFSSTAQQYLCFDYFSFRLKSTFALPILFQVP